MDDDGPKNSSEVSAASGDSTTETETAMLDDGVGCLERLLLPIHFLALRSFSQNVRHIAGSLSRVDRN